MPTLDKEDVFSGELEIPSSPGLNPIIVLVLGVGRELENTQQFNITKTQMCYPPCIFAGEKEEPTTKKKKVEYDDSKGLITLKV